MKFDMQIIASVWLITNKKGDTFFLSLISHRRNMYLF